jgi:hypothetical protein
LQDCSAVHRARGAVQKNLLLRCKPKGPAPDCAQTRFAAYSAAT